VNRLSDYLFVLARSLNSADEGDVLWRPGANRSSGTRQAGGRFVTAKETSP
jgi:hypothetical protein